jgi:hypothetical protein
MTTSKTPLAISGTYFGRQNVETAFKYTNVIMAKKNAPMLISTMPSIML